MIGLAVLGYSSIHNLLCMDILAAGRGFSVLLQMSLFLQHWLQQSTRTAIDMFFMNLLSCGRLACTDLVYALSLRPPCLFFRLLVFLSVFLFCLSV